MDYYTSSILTSAHTHTHTHDLKPMIISTEQMISGCTLPNWMRHLKTKYWYFVEKKTDILVNLYERQWSAEQFVGKLGAFEINYFIYLFAVHKYGFQS